MKFLGDMKAGTTISVIGHGAVLLWALVTFARPLNPMPPQAMGVDIISFDEFSTITAGVQNAPKQESPKPLVEKIAEAKPVEDPNAKVVEKNEVTASTAENTPEPRPKQPEPKPAAAPPQPQVEAKTSDQKEPEQKIDPIAEALKKDDVKKPEKKAETKPEPVKKPERQQPKFDPRKVAALLDKRDPQRVAASGPIPQSKPSLGTAVDKSAELSQDEIDALRARISQCWSMPPGLEAIKVIVDIRMQLRRDGSLEVSPVVLSRPSGPSFQLVAESALRAIRLCAPYSFLPAAKYDRWKDINISFDGGWTARM